MVANERRQDPRETVYLSMNKVGSAATRAISGNLQNAEDCALCARKEVRCGPLPCAICDRRVMSSLRLNIHRKKMYLFIHVRVAAVGKRPRLLYLMQTQIYHCLPRPRAAASSCRSPPTRHTCEVIAACEHKAGCPSDAPTSIHSPLGKRTAGRAARLRPEGSVGAHV